MNKLQCICDTHGRQTVEASVFAGVVLSCGCKWLHISNSWKCFVKKKRVNTNKGYRFLKDGDIIKLGDEIKYFDITWVPIGNHMRGVSYSRKRHVVTIRRKVEK